MRTTTRHPIWNRFAIVVSAALLAPLAPAAPFEIIALPDMENYIDVATGFPDVMSAQTQWIVDHRTAENIVCVTQLGDLIHHAPVDEMPEAVAAMFGVCASVFPKHDKSPQPMSSMNTTTMFGRGAADTFVADAHRAQPTASR